MKAFIFIVTTFLCFVTAQAESETTAWAGKGVALSAEDELLASYNVLLIKKDLGHGQTISYLFYDINPNQIDATRNLSDAEIEKKATCVVTRTSAHDFFVNCENGAGKGKCLGRLCQGIFATDDGDVFAASSVNDPKVKRRYLTKIKGEGPVKSVREILGLLPSASPAPQPAE
ncbi:MAG: hypothetical protein KDD43_09625 [Bdellovibrionales bacterium]|nr:hypothetical protein [Bdellovibrionales bacterium]